MATPFDKYLERLRQQKLGRTTENAYSKGASQLTSTGQYIANKMSGLRLGNTSASARAAIGQQAQSQIGQQVGELYGNRMQTEANQNMQINEKIGQIESQKDAYLKQQKDEKKSKERGMLGSLGQLGGAAIGAAGVLLAPATFGTSLLASSAIGAGLGGLAGSLLPTKSKADIDYIGAVQGASDAMIGYAGYANEKSVQSSMKMIGNNMGEIATLPSEKIMGVMQFLNMGITNGMNPTDIESYIKSITGGQ